MSKFTASSLFVVLFIFLATNIYPAFAEEATTESAIKEPSIRKKVNIRKEKIEEREAKVAEKIEKLQDKVDLKIESLREKQASKTALLKSKLEKFKNKEKAEKAEKINTNLNKINQNQTTQMRRHLENMTEILNKLEARMNRNEPDIKNPADAKAAIVTARNTIATTSAAVQTQYEKDYTISVTSESRIRLDAKSQRDKLHNDLQATRKLVINAKQSVGNAIRVAKSNKLEKSEIKEATRSGKQ